MTNKPLASERKLQQQLCMTTLAQSQKSKIENLVREARQHRNVMQRYNGPREKSNSNERRFGQGGGRDASGEEKIWQEMQDRAIMTLSKMVKNRRRHQQKKFVSQHDKTGQT